MNGYRMAGLFVIACAATACTQSPADGNDAANLDNAEEVERFVRELRDRGDPPPAPPPAPPPGTTAPENGEDQPTAPGTTLEELLRLVEQGRSR